MYFISGMLTPTHITSLISLLEEAGREIMRIYRNEDFEISLKTI